MLTFIGTIAVVALLVIFLVGVGRAVRANDRPAALRRAVSALVGQAVLLLALGVPVAVELAHHLSGPAASM
ncbi:MAG TPA: hypothetical protein VE081_12695 [Sporichthyaceae bacterium]|nr:hypothetical protein [Sporichthyaceae bacterium]